jgi:hypothetical protein
MPPYKTIVLELLQDRPILHEQLRQSRTMLESLNHLAMALRACHNYWMNQLAAARPGSDPMQISSEALEMALQELQESLPPGSSPSEETTEALSLDAAMAFLQRYTPAA